MLDTCFSVAFVFLALLSLLNCQETVSQNFMNPLQDDKSKVDNSDDFDARARWRKMTGKNPGNLKDILKNVDVEEFRRLDFEKLLSPPPIREPDCENEIQTVKFVPGKCIKLIGGIPACQGEGILSLNHRQCK